MVLLLSFHRKRQKILFIQRTIAIIKNIWMQQGSEAKDAINFCKDNGIDVVHGECILMFAEPVSSIHSLHRWINKLIGKYPKI